MKVLSIKKFRKTIFFKLLQLNFKINVLLKNKNYFLNSIVKYKERQKILKRFNYYFMLPSMRKF